jgi:hypothetical protein
MKTEWVNRIVMGIWLIVAALIYVSIVQWLHWYGWLAEIAWVITVQLVLDRYEKRKRQALTKLWALADQLGYDEAKIAQFTPQYGRIDWQLAHPDNLQFQPSDSVIAQVIDQLERDLETLA